MSLMDLTQLQSCIEYRIEPSRSMPPQTVDLNKKLYLALICFLDKIL